MDPGGLVVGFEWEQTGVARLSHTIHRNNAGDSGSSRQTTLLTRALPGMEDHRLASAYYREAVQNFHAKCAHR